MTFEKMKITDSQDLTTVLNSLNPGQKYELYFNYDEINNPLQQDLRIDVEGYLWQLRMMLNTLIQDKRGAFYPVMLNLSYGG